VTAGIVSAHNRDIGSGPYDFLQIDAAVNRGNSGGPAFNLEGKVVGVNTAIFSPSGGNVGIAFAVPAALAKNVVSQLKEHKSVARGWLGVTIQNVTEDLADSVGLDDPRGAMVTKLSQGGPASKSDMEVGDVILKVDGDAIRDSRDLARKIAAYRPKTEVQVTVLRDGKERDVTVELGRFPGMKQLAALEKDGAEPDTDTDTEKMSDLGLSLAPAADYAGAGDHGVVITDVDPDSHAAEKGLKEGDVILEVAGQNVSDPGDVVEGVRKAKAQCRKAVLMRVKSGNQVRFVALRFKKA
jgi:serine protease Do